ncbi:MAG: ABC transporter permease [Ruminococcaceae bacterium]|nr:ABC transporter permease [Oscillospiraceae bacterium]
MYKISALIKRNSKLFFKDKGVFFTSLITPLILLVLYATFLSNVYRDSFMAGLPQGFNMPGELIDGLVGGQLISSLLAVSCVTVSFCANMIMVSDKVTGARRDLNITPVKGSHLAIGYYVATLFVTLIICYIAMGAGLIYLLNIGWYLSLSDVLFMALDVFLLTMFGTALSSVINFFLSTQGQISAVGSIVSSCYGFICGAYMPISSFAEGLQKVLSFFPGTYATGLFRNHATRGAFEEMQKIGLSDRDIGAMKDAIDCNIYFFDSKVHTRNMYLILGASVIVLVSVYVVMNVISSKRSKVTK